MGRRAFVRFVYFLLIGGLALYTVREALAAVELDSFRVEPGDSQVALDWETGTEFEAGGFFIRRNVEVVGDYADWSRIEVVDEGGNPTTFIAPRGDAIGAEYNFLDLNVVNGNIYCYVLEAVDIYNVSEYFEPDNGTCHRPNLPPTPTLTPTVTETSPPTDTPTTTLTPTASATGSNPTSTSTRTPAATSTTRPSRTPSPTITETLPPSETPTITSTPTNTLTPTQTPFPTFLPTRTNTPTLTPTATQTLIPSPTRGPLLAATLAADGPGGRLFRLGGENALTLGELILAFAGLVALIGGLLFALLYFLLLRNSNQ